MTAEVDKQSQIDDNASGALTVEQVLYGLIILAGLAMRVIALEAEPLAQFEAANAWAAWLAATHTQVAHAPLPSSALLYGLQSLLFWLTGATDGLARLVPVIVGTATVALPWFWRSWIGRLPALVVAALFAVDPWLVAFGRAADGIGLTILCALLAITALWQWGTALSPKQRGRWERVAAVAVGLLLTTGVQAWSFVPVVLLFWGVCVWPISRQKPGVSSLWWFAGALVLGSSGLFLRPEAVGALSTSLTGWLDQFLPADGGSFGPQWPFVRLLVDQPLLAVFGPIGLIWLWVDARAGRAGRQMPLVLTLWLVWGIFLLVLPGRSPFVLPIVGLPLAVATGWVVGRLLQLSLRDVSDVEILVLLVVEAVLLVTGSIWLAGMVDSPSFTNQLLVSTLVIGALMMVVWVLFGFWAGWEPTMKLAGLSLAAVLFLVTVRSSWLLNQQTGLMKPDGFFAAVTDPDARMLAKDVSTLSSLRHGDPYELEVQIMTSGQPDATLGWYLRAMHNLRWATAPDIRTPDGAVDRPLVIAPQQMPVDAQLPEDTIGSDYRKTSTWDPSDLPAPPEQGEVLANDLPAEESARLRDQTTWEQVTRPRLEWLLYRTVKTPPDVQSVTLWAAR